MANLPMRPHVQRLAILKANDTVSSQEIADIIGKSIRYVQMVLADLRGGTKPAPVYISTKKRMAHV